jgi:hypothetical protein
MTTMPIYEQRFGRFNRIRGVTTPIVITNHAKLFHIDAPSDNAIQQSYEHINTELSAHRNYSTFFVNWQKSYNDISIRYHHGELWLYINRKDRFNPGNYDLPLALIALETLGM